MLCCKEARGHRPRARNYAGIVAVEIVVLQGGPKPRGQGPAEDGVKTMVASKSRPEDEIKTGVASKSRPEYESNRKAH